MEIRSFLFGQKKENSFDLAILEIKTSASFPAKLRLDWELVSFTINPCPVSSLP